MARHPITVDNFKIDADCLRVILCVFDQEIDLDDYMPRPAGAIYLDAAGFAVCVNQSDYLCAVAAIGAVPNALHGATIHVNSLPESAGASIRFVEEGRGFLVKHGSKTCGAVMSTGERLNWREKFDLGVGGYTLRRFPALYDSDLKCFGRIAVMGLVERLEFQFTTSGQTIAAISTLNVFIACGVASSEKDNESSMNEADWVREALKRRQRPLLSGERITFPPTPSESPICAPGARTKPRVRVRRKL